MPVSHSAPFKAILGPLLETGVDSKAVLQRVGVYFIVTVNFHGGRYPLMPTTHWACSTSPGQDTAARSECLGTKA